jgi:hypothetical protein
MCDFGVSFKANFPSQATEYAAIDLVLKFGWEAEKWEGQLRVRGGIVTNIKVDFVLW